MISVPRLDETVLFFSDSRAIQYQTILAAYRSTCRLKHCLPSTTTEMKEEMTSISDGGLGHQ